MMLRLNVISEQKKVHEILIALNLIGILQLTLRDTDFPWDSGNYESILLTCLILSYRILALHVFICLIFWAEVNVMAIYAKPLTEMNSVANPYCKHVKLLC